MAHGFRSSFGNISGNGLKNIYSGPERAPRVDLACKESILNRKLEKREKMIEELRKSIMNDKVIKRLNDYVPEYKIYLPKAPAFREADDATVDDIVDRLYHPSVRGGRRRSDRVTKSEESQPRMNYSESEVNLIYERLHQAETQTFRNRQVIR